jgi:hypothetical protein
MVGVTRLKKFFQKNPPNIITYPKIIGINIEINNDPFEISNDRVSIKIIIKLITLNNAIQINIIPIKPIETLRISSFFFSINIKIK